MLNCQQLLAYLHWWAGLISCSAGHGKNYNLGARTSLKLVDIYVVRNNWIAFVSSAFEGQSMEEDKNQESIKSSTTPDPGHHIGKLQKHRKHNLQESQAVSPFPRRWSQGCKEQTRNYNKNKTNNTPPPPKKKKQQKKKTAPWNGQ